MPVLMPIVFLGGDAPQRHRRDAGDPRASPARTRSARADPVRTSSTRVFQSPHPGHCPAHRGVSWPQAEHT